MKRSEVKDFIPLLQAWADGKTIQTKGFGPDGYGCWVDVKDYIDTDENLWMYRIKPEPREWYIYVDERGFLRGCAESILPIRVREVTE